MIDSLISPKQLQTPVLFLVFNRPDTTQRVFDAIRKAKPPRLYIAADGVRIDRPGEAQMVEQVREIATAVDWPCEVKTLFREQNLGCKHAVSGAITWFFEHEEQGIILEDDCLPDLSFFGFCENLLNFYAENQQIMHIGGYKPVEIPSINFDISFSRVTHVWGWATWRNRWSKYKLDINQSEKEDLYYLDKYEFFNSKSKTAKRKRILTALYDGKINTWDYQWNFTVRTNSGLAIRPNINLVMNIGDGHPQATHTFRKRKKPNPASSIDKAELCLPNWIMINRDTEKVAERLL